MTEPCPICAEWRYISLVKVCPICGEAGGLEELNTLAEAFLETVVGND
jgi:hypothetical protein